MLSAAFRASPSERSEGANNIPAHKCAIVYGCICVCVLCIIMVCMCVYYCACVYMYIHIRVGRRVGGGGEGVHDILEKGGYPNSSAKRQTRLWEPTVKQMLTNLIAQHDVIAHQYSNTLYCTTP